MPWLPTESLRVGHRANSRRVCFLRCRLNSGLEVFVNHSRRKRFLFQRPVYSTVEEPNPFTVAKAEVRLYGDADSAKPLAAKELPGLTDRLVAGGTQTVEGIQIASTEVPGDSKRVASGKWKLEIFLHVYNALHTQVYKYLYDEEHGIRRLSE